MSLVGYARGSTTEGSRVLDCEFNAFRASGTTSDRPNLAACLDYLRRDVVLIVLDLDRLGWLASGFSTYIDEFSVRRIGFRVLNSPINTTMLTGRTHSRLRPRICSSPTRSAHVPVNLQSPATASLRAGPGARFAGECSRAPE